MIQLRKQRIVYFVIVGALAVPIISLLVYLFATGSLRAVPELLYLLGFIAGILLVYFATRSLERRRVLADHLTRRFMLVSIVILGLATGLVLPRLVSGEDTVLGEFMKGLGFDVFLAALVLPRHPYSQARVRQER